MTWSLTRELEDASGSDGLMEAIRALGMCPHDHYACDTSIVEDWYRAGGETYALVFDVVHNAGRSRNRYFMKACVALGPGASVGEVAAEWLRRRTILAASGVSVPALFYLHRAVFLEEFVPLTAREAYAGAGADIQHQIATGLGFLAYTLMNLGFPTMSLHDLRSRGSDVVVVDFGSDLGPPAVAPASQSDLLELACREARAWSVDAVAAVVHGYSTASLSDGGR